MSESELRLECLKVAVQIVSSSVNDRCSQIIETAEKFFNFAVPKDCDILNDELSDTPRRGRKPKQGPVLI